MRKLTPELLDHLPPDDPGAIRARQDLRRINSFMGNDSWILRNIPAKTPRITEIGSGDGNLLEKIHKRFPNTPLNAFDLAPKPDGLSSRIEWLQSDILETVPNKVGDTLVANLILHHFTDTQIARLAAWFGTFDTIIVNEPLRSPLPAFLAKLACPFVHTITRHDMRVSIEAGFVFGELPEILQLKERGFVIRETSTWQGSLRMLASKT